MKLRILMVAAGMAALFLNTGILYAANGDLVVNGNLSVGTGITFPDGSVQTTAKRLVWDYTVAGSAVTTVTSPTLDGNADRGYEFEFIIVNSSTGVPYYYCFYNNDQVNTNYTNARYLSSFGNNSWIEQDLSSGAIGRIYGTFFISPQGYVGMQSVNVALNGNLFTFWHQRKNAAVTNLTRIDIVSSLANGIGAGSSFRMWRRN